MANRYATVPIHYHNGSSGKDEHVPLGSLRDSASAVVTALPGLFSSTPLTAGSQVTGVLAQYLLVYPGGP